MRFKKYTITVLILALSIVGCQDPYNDDVGPSDTDYVTNDPQYTPTALDNWLLDNFTYPYNIEVKYRWDASEGDLYKTLVPPKVTKVQPLMEVVKDVWINPYATLAGGTFIKTYCPKQFLLIGSARYNVDGTFTLGTAEGGRKVVLYVVNDFVPTDRLALKDMLHTVHHEFGHILNQKASYPSAYREITSGGYTADWRFTSLAQARANGFITSYAMASPDEDFVEMIATMLIQGKEDYESILACETNANSRAILKKKEQLVVQYYKDAFNIDFYALQTKVQEALDQIAPPDEDPEVLPPLFDEWGFEKDKTAVRFDLTQMNEPAEFSGRFSQDNSIMHNEGLALDYNFKLYFTSENELALKVYYYTIDEEDRVYQQANFYYFMTQNEDGTTNLFLNGGDDNAMYLANELRASALAAFFADRTFTIDWLRTCSGQVFVGFIPKDSPANYCYGMLDN
jgi:substrate import-associated zinc metallohydrolase lipoprotein